MKKEITAIIQARMGSTRLPGKVLAGISGKPAIWQELFRLRHSKLIDKMVIATTTLPVDDIIKRWCDENSILCFRGAGEDVLDRYYQCAKKNRADTIVRITGDCPLIDPRLVDKAIKEYLGARGTLDYVALGPDYPDGLDTEVFSFSALEKAWKEAKLKSEREHVSPYIWNNPKIFKIKILKNKSDLKYLRWTLDEPEDLILIRKIFKQMNKNNNKPRIFYMKDILKLLEKRPELLTINSDIGRNEGYQKSIKENGKI